MKKVIVFSATWCANCNAQKQKLTQAGIEYEVVDIDVDEEMQKAREFKVRSLPTTVIVDGDTIVKQLIGITNTEEVKKLLKD